MPTSYSIKLGRSKPVPIGRPNTPESRDFGLARVMARELADREGKAVEILAHEADPANPHHVRTRRAAWVQPTPAAKKVRVQ